MGLFSDVKKVYSPLDPPERRERNGGAPVWLTVTFGILCLILVIVSIAMAFSWYQTQRLLIAADERIENFQAEMNSAVADASSEGYDKGYSDGYSEGSEAGYSDGYSNGYDGGYEDGLDVGYYRALNPDWKQQDIAARLDALQEAAERQAAAQANASKK